MAPQKDKYPLLTGFAELANKIIPPLAIAAIISICVAAGATYMAVEKITEKVIDHGKQIEMLRIKIDQVEINSVKRQELLEILKRVEQQLEIALLRSGVKVPPKMLTQDR